jgi:hypothetical protein
MTPAHPARHLLRAKDLVDARYRDPLDVRALAGAALLSPAHFSRGQPYGIDAGFHDPSGNQMRVAQRQ